MRSFPRAPVKRSHSSREKKKDGRAPHAATVSSPSSLVLLLLLLLLPESELESGHSESVVHRPRQSELEAGGEWFTAPGSPGAVNHELQTSLTQYS